jgi:hypothetical protein
MRPDLLKLAGMATQDPAGIPVLGDAIIETEWADHGTRVQQVMALCLGVPIDPWPPEGRGIRARTVWHGKRRRSITFAATQWERYAGHRSDWARAVLAVMLFADWSPARETPLYGSRCPWLTVWRNATGETREWANARRRITRERRTSTATTRKDEG